MTDLRPILPPIKTDTAPKLTPDNASRRKTQFSALTVCAVAGFGLSVHISAIAAALPTTPPLFTNMDIATATSSATVTRSKVARMSSSQAAAPKNKPNVNNAAVAQVASQTKKLQIKVAEASITDRVTQELEAQQLADNEAGEVVVATTGRPDASADKNVAYVEDDAIASIGHGNNTADNFADHVAGDTIDNTRVAPKVPSSPSQSVPTNKNQIITSLSDYEQQVNRATWSPNMRKNTAMTIKIQALLDWNHASPGPIDGGWGINSKKALTNFQVMRHLPATGSLDAATWQALTKNIEQNRPALTKYRLTEKDVNTHFMDIPASSEAKSKLKGLYYQNIKEMLGERFHMDVRYIDKLNKGKAFVAGDTLTVINVGAPLNVPVNRVVANKANETLYAYHDDTLVATYPTTVGSDATPSPHGTFQIVNKVKMPWYKATVGDGEDKKVYMLAPGPNNPVGVVWMGLSKPSYGIHGSPWPEGISRQASHGCIRLTNWDVIELYANIEKGAAVEII